MIDPMLINMQAQASIYGLQQLGLAQASSAGFYQNSLMGQINAMAGLHHRNIGFPSIYDQMESDLKDWLKDWDKPA